MNDFPTITHSIAVPYRLRVFFTNCAFAPDNPLFGNVVGDEERGVRSKLLFYIDEAVAVANPDLQGDIYRYCVERRDGLDLRGIYLLPGGEAIKNETDFLKGIYSRIGDQKICRHSYLVAIGGGALLDTVGFAASTAHRGIRHIRLPTTTLSQGDAGVGVKNGFNFRGKKNFVGSFAPPFAVINDFSLLETLPPQHLRNGFIEAVKVALIRDRRFFEWIEQNASALASFDKQAVRSLVHQSAKLHLDHIANSGDPFERGSVRPLDFGHWAAHKLEQLSDFRLSHGEAVAIGIAIDTLYSRKIGYLAQDRADRVLALIRKLGFALFDECLDTRDAAGTRLVTSGIEEFREHLGGTLTITLLRDVGSPANIHMVDIDQIHECVDQLKGCQHATFRSEAKRLQHNTARALGLT